MVYEGDEDDGKAAEKAPPVEPSGYDLTDRRDRQAWVKHEMEKVAETINTRLRETAERQTYVKDDTCSRRKRPPRPRRP